LICTFVWQLVTYPSLEPAHLGQGLYRVQELPVGLFLPSEVELKKLVVNFGAFLDQQSAEPHFIRLFCRLGLIFLSVATYSVLFEDSVKAAFASRRSVAGGRAAVGYKLPLRVLWWLVAGQYLREPENIHF